MVSQWIGLGRSAVVVLTVQAPALALAVPQSEPQSAQHVQPQVRYQPVLGPPGLPLATTLEDFFMPGTQPGDLNTEIFTSDGCAGCHASFNGTDHPIDAEPWRNWVASMMGQAGRDPVFWAANTIANQDAGDGGDICLRCHAAGGWLAGRSVPTDGSALTYGDFDGVTCHLCHRIVNPVYVEGESPAVDADILDDLDMNCPPDCFVPQQPGTARYVIDLEDRRRGPFDLIAHPPPHPWLRSPLHQTSRLCATCHDVENPQYVKQGDAYVMTGMDMPHPSMDKYEMFPIERTYSEWANSQFANGGVDTQGRFGTNPGSGLTETCQDCHMPDQVSPGCILGGYTAHDDMPAHFLNGGNTWVLKAVYELYTDGDPLDDPPFSYNDPVYIDFPSSGLQYGPNDNITPAIDRVTQMLRDASDMELTQDGNDLVVRITNRTGHKLPTGYPEGRRMWVNVKFYDGAAQLIDEHGAYDFATAALSTQDTKVYETRLGIDDAVAARTGLPAGESFHFILNNVILKDNRIPPEGFTNAAFAAVQAAPAGHSYADGQNWDDTPYPIPLGAAEAVVTLYYQTTSREYIEFLRDRNTTNSRGVIAYNQWVAQGRSAPVDMDMETLALAPIVPGDLTNDGVVGVDDMLALFAAWGPCGDPCPPWCAGDLNGDCVVGVDDFLILFANWG